MAFTTMFLACSQAPRWIETSVLKYGMLSRRSDQPTGRLALVFELMDMNIYELIRGRRHYVAEDRVKSYMYQLIKAMDHMHRNGIFHRWVQATVNA